MSTFTNHQFVSCFDKLSDAICIVNNKLIIEYCNVTFKNKHKQSNLTPNETSIANFVSEAVLYEIETKLRNNTSENTYNILDKDENKYQELKYIEIDNQSKIVLIEKCINYDLINGKQELIETQEKFKATTEQLKFSTKEIEIYENRFHSVLNKMPILLMAIDNSKQILFWSSECERVTGFLSKNIINQPNAYKLIFNEDEFNVLINKSRIETFRNYKTVSKCSNGKRKNILWSSLSKNNPIPKWDNWVVGIDITEKHEQEERILYESNVNESLAKSSSELISPSLSIDKIAHLLFTSCIKITSCETGFIAYDDTISDNVLIHYFAKSPLNKSPLKSNFCFIPRSEYFNTGFYGYPIDYDKPRIENELNIPIKRKFGSDSLKIVKNCIVQPAIANGVLIGQIVLINTPTKFNKRHHNFVKSLANIYALAIYRKRMEWDLLSAKKNAEESDRLKTAFLANMSHEIRTPMNAIVGFSELLLIENINTNKKLEFNKLIRNSCDDLLMLVNDIIDISKIEAGQLKFHPTKFSIKELLIELKHIGEQRIATKEKSLRIIFDNQKDIDFDIFVDKIRIKQIFLNLIGNAIKFTDVGSIHFGFHFKKNKFITFYVKDTGIGISHDEQKNIFESFRQIETTISRNYGGTGLGLSISKNLTEQMGGSLNIISDLDKGSLFSFTIPFSKQKTNKKLQNIKHSQKPKKLKLNNKTILVVEDEPRNAKLISILLTTIHAKVVNAYNGLEAIEAVKKEKPDLVLMDIQMPEMDGLEATKRIKSIYSDIPIIAQTAYAMKEDREKCIKAGCNGYISKPIKKDELFSVIEKNL